MLRVDAVVVNGQNLEIAVRRFGIRVCRDHPALLVWMSAKFGTGGCANLAIENDWLRVRARPISDSELRIVAEYGADSDENAVMQAA